MQPSWNEPSYPQRHHDVVRSALRDAARVVAIAGALFSLMLLATLFGPVPPFVTALAGAMVLLAVLGGIRSLDDTRRHVRIIPFFQRRLGNIDTFLAGEHLVRFLRQLDAVATGNGVKPLSAFGFHVHDDLRGESLQWSSADEGLHTVTTLLESMEHSPDQQSIPAEVFDDLHRWRHGLEHAASGGISFCIILRHGNLTTSHEWSGPNGSAF